MFQVITWHNPRCYVLCILLKKDWGPHGAAPTPWSDQGGRCQGGDGRAHQGIITTETRAIYDDGGTFWWKHFWLTGAPSSIEGFAHGRLFLFWFLEKSGFFFSRGMFKSDQRWSLCCPLLRMTNMTRIFEEQPDIVGSLFIRVLRHSYYYYCGLPSSTMCSTRFKRWSLIRFPEKRKPRETKSKGNLQYAQCLTPFCTYFRISLHLLHSIAVLAPVLYSSAMGVFVEFTCTTLTGNLIPVWSPI